MNVDWTIIYTSNGMMCEEFKTVEFPYIDYICNARTDGLEKYGHPELRIVLDLGPNEIMRILNTIGLRIQNGEKYKDGDFISGIYEDCNLKVVDINEGDYAYPALRVVIPDSQNRFPEDQDCEEVYNLQKYKLKDLERNNNLVS